MDATIYVLKDPRTNEIKYVGCTKNIQERYKAHTNKARDLHTPKRKWITELRELSLKPILEELEVIDEQFSIAKEKEYIKLFRSQGCNLVNTGDLNNNGNSTSFDGSNSIPVIALTLDGDFFNSYPSTKEASKQLNISTSNIWSVLSKTTKTAGKLIWVYEDDYYDLSDEDIDLLIYTANDKSQVGGKETRFKKGVSPWNKDKHVKLKRDKHVFQYSGLSGEFIQEWTTAKEASEALFCSMEGIGQCARKQAKTAGGYIWRYTKYDSVKPVKYLNKTNSLTQSKLK